mmetsp:Transcript_38169/g.80317  ORF Transcript_38169/g.80317 Transcript_38169/m.80317 type:complete len:151 (+) Transcript_38169:108-560(+)
MPLRSKFCNHPGCKNLVFTQDSCHTHSNGNKVDVRKKKKSPVDISRRTVSMSKDGTSSRAYKQCSHGNCTNIAKKFGRCYSHGAPRKTCSAAGCKSNAQKRGLCRKHYKHKEMTPTPLAEAGNVCHDCSDILIDDSEYGEFWEGFVAEFS